MANYTGRKQHGATTILLPPRGVLLKCSKALFTSERMIKTLVETIINVESLTIDVFSMFWRMLGGSNRDKMDVGGR